MNNKNTVKKLNRKHLIDDLKYRLIIEGIVVGLVTGVIVSLFRLVLSKIELYRSDLISFFSESPIKIILGILLITLLIYICAFVCKKEPLTSGSGIPQVKGEVVKNIKSTWYKVLIYKFIGGTASIFAGLSLGREGSSIQLGAMIGKGLSRIGGRLSKEEKYLMLCGAGAGLAAAFSAPLSGVLFVLEEIRRKFSHKALLCTMSGAITADWVASKMFGLEPAFNINIEADISLKYFWAFILLGLVCGLISVLYIKLLFLSKKAITPIVKNGMIWPITILILVAITIFYPIALGSGHSLIELVSNPEGPGLKYILILFIVKFLFSIFSFITGAPGGTLQPILVIGGLVGSIFGILSTMLFGMDASLIPYFVVLGMVGCFSGIVRTPITGVMLIIELTGMELNLLSLAIPILCAYVVADLLRTRPVYDMLLDDLLNRNNM